MGLRVYKFLAVIIFLAANAFADCKQEFDKKVSDPLVTKEALSLYIQSVYRPCLGNEVLPQAERPKSKKESTKSISALCSEKFQDDEAQLNKCEEVYSTCSEDIESAPKNKKEGKRQADCIVSISNKRSAEKDQAAQNNETLELQRQQMEIQQQQLAIQQQQQRLQMYNTLIANPIIRTQQVQPFPMMKTPRQTNCNPNGAGGFNCTGW